MASVGIFLKPCFKLGRSRGTGRRHSDRGGTCSRLRKAATPPSSWKSSQSSHVASEYGRDTHLIRYMDPGWQSCSGPTLASNTRSTVIQSSGMGGPSSVTSQSSAGLAATPCTLASPRDAASSRLLATHRSRRRCMRLVLCMRMSASGSQLACRWDLPAHLHMYSHRLGRSARGVSGGVPGGTSRLRHRNVSMRRPSSESLSSMTPGTGMMRSHSARLELRPPFRRRLPAPVSLALPSPPESASSARALALGARCPAATAAPAVSTSGRSASSAVRLRPAMLGAAMVLSLWGAQRARVAGTVNVGRKTCKDM